MLKSLNRNDIFIMFILLLSGLKYTFEIEIAQDIALYDESLYLYRGVALLSNGLPPPDWAPLYAVWYFMLSLLQPNRIGLYFLNYKLVMILLPVFLYIALRRLSVRLFPSTITAFFFLISYANLCAWPRVTHFVLLLILATFIVTSYIKSFKNKLAIFCVSALLSSYLRPELFLTFLLLFLSYLGGIIVFQFKERKRFTVVVAISVFLLSGFLIQLFGLPIGSGNKSTLTFEQHFSLNWVLWKNSELSPYANLVEILLHPDYLPDEIIHRNFGKINSVSEAIFRNPALFMKHIASNLMHTPRKLAGSFFCHSNILLPNQTSMIENYLLLGFVLLYAIFFRNDLLSRMKNNIKTNKDILFFTSCYLSASFIAIVLFYPRDHHLLLVGTLMIVVIASLSVSKIGRPERFHYKQLLLLGLIVISLIPQTPCSADGYVKENIETIKFIDSLNITGKTNILEVEGGYSYYLSPNFQSIIGYEKSDAFFSFQNKHHINLIILSKQLLNDPRFKNDKEWQSFLSTYEALGYIKLHIPNTNKELIVARQLIQSSKSERTLLSK